VTPKNQILKRRGDVSRDEARQQKLAHDEQTAQLFNLVTTQPEKFGAVEDEEGEYQIINPQTGLPVKNSNIMKTISRLTNPKSSYSPDPPGFRNLKAKILADENARQLINKRYLQSGKGCRNKKIANIKECQKVEQKFRPIKWTKTRRGK
jgi:hypothetical protein